jgi:hypothetical protein
MQDYRWDLFEEGLTKKDVANLSTDYSADAETKKQYEKKMDRRTFTKIAVGTAVTGGIAVFGGRYLIPPSTSFSYRTPNRNLNFVVPNSGEEIQFVNETDEPWYLPGVGYEWSIDERIASRQRGYSAKLAATRTYNKDKQDWVEGAQHAVRLTGRRGFVSSSYEHKIDVDPESLPQYPPQPLGIPIKGINFEIGYENWWDKPLSEEEMTESLHIIRNELKCNAVRIFGDFEDALIKCGEIAVSKRFDIALLSPRYRKTSSGKDVTIEQHVGRIIDFSKKAEILRQTSNSTDIILAVGNELTIDTIGIYNGHTYADRVKQIKENWGKSEYHEKLNLYLKQIVDGVRKNFHGKITYTKGGGGMGENGWEYVKWNELGFDIVSSNEYIESAWNTTEQQIGNINDLKIGKPLFITEFGCLSYEGAGKYGSTGEKYYTNQKYSQAEQGEYIISSARLYGTTGVNAIFYFPFMERIENDSLSMGIIKYQKRGLGRRKVGFYSFCSLK